MDVKISTTKNCRGGGVVSGWGSGWGVRVDVN